MNNMKEHENNFLNEPPIRNVDTGVIAEKAQPLISSVGYQKLRRNVVLVTTLVAIVPLVIMTIINYSYFVTYFYKFD